MRRLLAGVTVLALTIATGCGRGNAPDTRTAAATQTTKPAAWTPVVQPLDVPAAARSFEPFISTSPRGLLLSWIEPDGHASTLKFAERTPTGWSDVRTAASGHDWFVSWADVPSVMRLTNGTLVANWFRNTNIQQEGYDLWLSYSRDDGRTWAMPFTPHHDRTQTQHGFASLFETPDKGLGMVWLDAREYELNKTDPEGGSVMLRYAAFDPSWKQTADAMVNARVCECCQTSAAVTPDGVVVAFRDRTQDEIRDIHVTRFANGAWSDPTPVHEDHWEIDSCPVNGPAISAHGRQLATAWCPAAGSQQGQAFAAFSTDAGRTWGEPIRLDDGRSLGHVDIEMLDDGTAVASWVEFADQRARLRIRRVEPSGAKSAAIEIAGAAGGRVSGYPRMARQGDDLLLAWTESAGGEDDEDAMQQVKGAVARLPHATAPSPAAE
jgi:hypothetical protein